MKRLVYIAALLLAGVSARCMAASSSADACRTSAGEILLALKRGDYTAATARFDTVLHANLAADKLAQVWRDALPAQLGAFAAAADASATALDRGTLVEVPLRFANGWLNMRVSCSADAEVTGLFFAPGAAPENASAPTANADATAIDVPLAVASPLGPLAGTLTLPRGSGPFAAVLLVAGSGPNDRDETIWPNKPLADIARGLAAAGIASLRYDKRTRVYAAQFAGRSIGVDDEVTDDAVAALRLLARQPHIDGSRVFLLGHSLGAFMAPRIAERDAQIAGLILLAAPARFDLDVVLRQTRYIAGVQHATEQQIEAAIAPIATARDAIARADPEHPPAGEFFHAPASYWLSVRDYRPIDVAKNLPQPILLLQGSADYQVTPADDFSNWQTAFAHSTRVTTKEYPGLSHLFMPAGTPPSPADYTQPNHVDARVIADIAQWIAAKPRAEVH